jgi:hypothetical protein
MDLREIQGNWRNTGSENDKTRQIYNAEIKNASSRINFMIYFEE